MKRVITILVLTALCVAHAHAQRWLGMQCIDAPPAYPKPETAAKPICLPAPKGAGTAPIVESNLDGAAAAWWCKRQGKEPVLYLYAVRWDAVTPGLVADLLAGAMSSAQTSAIQSTLLKNQTHNIRDMCDVWGPAAPRISAAKPGSGASK